MLFLPNAEYLNVNLWVTSSRIKFILIKIRGAVFELRSADWQSMMSVLHAPSLYVRSSKTTAIIRAGDDYVAIYRFAVMTFSVTKFVQNYSGI